MWGGNHVGQTDVSRRGFRWSCGKHWHRNRKAAIAGIDTHRRKFRVGAPTAESPDLWPYRCPDCNGWHITSRPQPGIEPNTGRPEGAS